MTFEKILLAILFCVVVLLVIRIRKKESPIMITDIVDDVWRYLGKKYGKVPGDHICMAMAEIAGRSTASLAVLRGFSEEEAMRLMGVWIKVMNASYRLHKDSIDKYMESKAEQKPIFDDQKAPEAPLA